MYPLSAALSAAPSAAAKRILAALACLLMLAAVSSAPAKTLRVYLNTSESGMDPAVASDIVTLGLIENVFDPLLRYDYLARPVALRGNTALGLPQLSADRRSYTFRLRPGIWFTPDPAFGAARRELVAADYVYSIKRLYDPRLRSPWLALFEGKIAGDAALRAPGRTFSDDTPVAGLQALDRYTLRITLTEPDNNFLYYLAAPASGAVAREVIEAYPGQAGNHPVGTGPFRVGEWKRSDRIVLLAQRQPHTRFEGTNGSGSADAAVAARLQGRELPLVERIEIKVTEEFQGRMLGFLDGQFDYVEQVPESMTSMVVENGVLKPALAARGMRLHRFPVLQTYYVWMNMEDPVLGGVDVAKVALRRAIAMAYRSDIDIGLLKQGFAVKAESLVPPGVLGHDPAYRSPVAQARRLANALLDRHGYGARDADGYRQGPGGVRLTLRMHSEATAAGRLRDEMWRRVLASIGIRIAFVSDKKSEIIKASRQGKVQMFETNWIADYADADNFYQLLYGPNAGRANYARFSMAAYDRLLEQARATPNAAVRQGLYRRMNDILHAYNPVIPLTHPLSADVEQPWLRNYKRHPVELTVWRYLDVDTAARAARR